MDNNERIIEEVRKYDCLYNLQSGSYKNFQYKEDLWCKIGKDVGVPAEEAKKKFRNLRDTYKKWKQKDNLPSGSAALLRKPYRYAESLKFLDEVPSARKTICNVSEDSLDTTIDISNDSDTKSPPPLKKKKNIEQMQEKMQDFLDAASTSIGSLATSIKTDTTSQLFESLASRVNEANLTMQQKTHIESSVCALVYSMINEYIN